MRVHQPLLVAVVLAASIAGCRGMPLPLGIESRIAGMRAAADAAAGLPNRTEIVAGQLVIHADFPLASRHRLLRELEQLRVDVSSGLGLPISDEPVHLYLFDSEDRYAAFAAARFPGFPARRAFFVKTDTKLAVYAHWQDRIAEDLRHETTHGYLHAVVDGVPLWLDEGIAEYFEMPRSERKRHHDHADRLAGRLLEGTWQPDLVSLERIDSVAGLTQDHYAEAWCWIHWLLHSGARHRELIQEYLADLRRDPATPPLSVRLPRAGLGSPAACAAEVADHLRQMEGIASP